MDPSVLLKSTWRPQWPDPVEDRKKLLTLRDLMDQRRIREQQYQLQQQAMQEHARKAQYEQEDRQRAMTIRELFAKNPNPSFQDIAAVDPATAIKLDTDRRLMQSAASQQAKAALDLQGERSKREANTYAAVTALPQDQQQDWWDTNVGGGLPVDRPPTALEEQAKYAEAYGGKELQARQFARDKEIRDTEKYRLEVAKLLPEVTTAQNKAAGTEPPTGELAYFKNVYLPAWREAKKAPTNGATEIAAYEDFKKAGVQPQLLPADVEAQRVRMAQELADARAAAAAAAAGQKPATEGERKTLGFYERMKNAEEALGTVEDSLSKLSTMGQIRLKSAPDWAQTKEGQLYHQALRQFTEARLRKESGAVIGPSEFEYSEKTFFPQPNEDPATRKRKKEARELLLNSMRRESGKAYTQTYGEGEPSTTSSATATKGSGSEKPVIRWGKDANGNPVRLN